MRRAFEIFKDCDLDVRVVTYAGPVDPQLLAIAEDVASKAARAAEKKRLRVEDTKDTVKKRQKTEQGELLLPSAARAQNGESRESFLFAAGESSTVGETTPAVRKKELEGRPTSPPKADNTAESKKHAKGRCSKADKTAPQPVLDATVLREAEKLGYDASLRNLASRPEIIARGIKARIMLEALKRSDGLVNKAKNALLG